MYWALIRKEFREIAPIAAIAAVALLIAVGDVMGSLLTGRLPFVDYVLSTAGDDRDVPFAGYYFLYHLSSITFYFATVLGLRQTLGEDFRGTYLLLLHRPVPRRSIFAVKVLVGLVTFLLISSLAIVLLAWWAGTPGNQPAPFYWSMTIPSCHAIATTSLVYLGALLTGAREARWLGTRILPWYAASSLTKAIDLNTNEGVMVFIVALLLFATSLVWVTANREYA